MSLLFVVAIDFTVCLSLKNDLIFVPLTTIDVNQQTMKFQLNGRFILYKHFRQAV